MRNWLSSKSHHWAPARRDKIAAFSARISLMETSQIKQTIVDLAERADALRRYL
jgi:hypothetical protein